MNFPMVECGICGGVIESAVFGGVSILYPRPSSWPQQTSNKIALSITVCKYCAEDMARFVEERRSASHLAEKAEYEFKTEAEARHWYGVHNMSGDPYHRNEGNFIEALRKKRLIEELDTAQRGTTPSARPNGI